MCIGNFQVQKTCFSKCRMKGFAKSRGRSKTKHTTVLRIRQRWISSHQAPGYGTGCASVHQMGRSTLNWDGHVVVSPRARVRCLCLLQEIVFSVMWTEQKAARHEAEKDLYRWHILRCRRLEIYLQSYVWRKKMPRPLRITQFVVVNEQGCRFCLQWGRKSWRNQARFASCALWHWIRYSLRFLTADAH